MRLKVFTLRYDDAVGGFDDAPLQAFLADKDVIAVDDHFFVHEALPAWALLVSYRDVHRPGERPAKEEPRRKDWRADLSEDERALFDALREWRNAQAQRDGKPPYVILTNRQLARVAQARPDSREALRAIDGVGDSRVEAFGEALLAVVKTAARPVAADGPEGDDAGA